MRSLKNTMVKIGASLVSLLAGMVLVLSTTPSMASGENKVVNEKAMVEMNKVEKNKVEKEKVMLKEKKVDEQNVMKLKAHSDLGALLGEGILGEEILGEGILGIEED